MLLSTEGTLACERSNRQMAGLENRLEQIHRGNTETLADLSAVNTKVDTICRQVDRVKQNLSQAVNSNLQDMHLGVQDIVVETKGISTSSNYLISKVAEIKRDTCQVPAQVAVMLDQATAQIKTTVATATAAYCQTAASLKELEGTTQAVRVNSTDLSARVSQLEQKTDALQASTSTLSKEVQQLQGTFQSSMSTVQATLATILETLSNLNTSANQPKIIGVNSAEDVIIRLSKGPEETSSRSVKVISPTQEQGTSAVANYALQTFSEPNVAETDSEVVPPSQVTHIRPTIKNSEQPQTEKGTSAGDENVAQGPQLPSTSSLSEALLHQYCRRPSLDSTIPLEDERQQTSTEPERVKLPQELHSVLLTQAQVVLQDAQPCEMDSQYSQSQSILKLRQQTDGHSTEEESEIRFKKVATEAANIILALRNARDGDVINTQTQEQSATPEKPKQGTASVPDIVKFQWKGVARQQATTDSPADSDASTIDPNVIYRSDPESVDCVQQTQEEEDTGRVRRSRRKKGNGKPKKKR